MIIPKCWPVMLAIVATIDHSFCPLSHQKWQSLPGDVMMRSQRSPEVQEKEVKF